MFQEPQGSEGEGESLCSGNQDSFYTEVLISPRDTSSLRVECVCVRSMWWLFVCPLVFKLLFYFMFLMSRLLKVCVCVCVCVCES